MSGDSHVSPDAIFQLGTGYWASKTLLSAVELGVFTELAKGPRTADELAFALGIHSRGARDFFDALVALKMLERTGGVYANTPATDAYLDRNKPTYVGGLFEMMNARLYRIWGGLTAALRTGRPQNEAKDGKDLFGDLYADPKRLEGFVNAMTGVSIGPAKAMARKFPWSNFRSFSDIGTAQGAVPVHIALEHLHIEGAGFDLPVVQPLFERYVQSHNVHNRVRFVPGDFFRDDLPSTDVLIMGHILHDWNLEEKKTLLDKAYKALPKGGALVVYEALIDDERRSNAFGLLMSLNMLLETHGGFDFTAADCTGWMTEVGFKNTRVEHLVGPDSMVIGIKQ